MEGTHALKVLDCGGCCVFCLKISVVIFLRTTTYCSLVLYRLKCTLSNRPAALAHGIWDQVQVDHGKEFQLTLFMQELLSPRHHYWETKPYLQISSKMVQFYSLCS